MRIFAIPTEIVGACQAGGVDGNGQLPERQIAHGTGNPCRYCLRMIPEGAAMLVLAHRRFPVLQPDAEPGPIFLCGVDCAAGGGGGDAGFGGPHRLGLWRR